MNDEKDEEDAENDPAYEAERVCRNVGFQRGHFVVEVLGEGRQLYSSGEGGKGKDISLPWPAVRRYFQSSCRKSFPPRCHGQQPQYYLMLEVSYSLAHPYHNKLISKEPALLSLN